MLSQAVGYAASSLGLLAGSGRDRMLVREMAAGVPVPGPYLAKIMRQLAIRGIVITQKGIGGGVRLSRPAEEISLLDLCAALDDPIVEQRCMLGTADCSDERACPAHPFWKIERDRQLSFLRQTSLRDMAAFENRHLVRLVEPTVHR